MPLAIGTTSMMKVRMFENCTSASGHWKRSYATHKDARNALKKQPDKQRKEVYACPNCGKWHVASKVAK